jgi:septum formation topological specificity factor MinE
MSWPGSDELQIQLSEVENSPPPVTASRVDEILAVVQRHTKVDHCTLKLTLVQLYYKHIVLQIETFIRKTKAINYLSGVYIIDAIVKHQTHGAVYQKRFATNLDSILAICFKCPPDHKVRALFFIELKASRKK